MKSVGVIGYRSWIGQVLMDHIQEKTKHRIVMIDKSDAASWPTADYLALFIIPGKLVQTELEKLAERQLVHDIAASHTSCKRQILLGSKSSSADPLSEYGNHKRLVEESFLGAAA